MKCYGNEGKEQKPNLQIERSNQHRPAGTEIQLVPAKVVPLALRLLRSGIDGHYATG